MTIVCAIGAWWGLRVMALAEKQYPARWEPVYHKLRLPHAIEDYRPQFVFLLNWSDYVPDELLTRATFVNFHATPLPYGRGGHPIENMILRGHQDTVITAHRVTNELDAGPVYGVSELVSLDGTKDQIRARFVEPVTTLMLKILRGECQPTEQRGDVVTFKRLSDQEYRGFWHEREQLQTT